MGTCDLHAIYNATRGQSRVSFFGALNFYVIYEQCIEVIKTILRMA